MAKNKNKFSEKEIIKRLKEKRESKYNDNNNQDPYGYDFVVEVAHIENIDEQKEKVKYLEKISKND